MDSQNYNITFVLLTIANLSYFFFSSISAYNMNTIYIKIILGSLLLIIFILDIILSKHKFTFNLKSLLTLSFFKTKTLKERNFDLLIITSLLFVLLTFISVIWSDNKLYGIFKSANLILNIIFISCINVYYFRKLNYRNLRFLRFLTISISVLTFIISLLISPFNYDASHTIGITRWSHVQYSSFLALTFFISMITFYYRSEKNISKNVNKILYLSLFGFLILGLYYTALRSSIIGIILASAFILLNLLITKKRYSQKLIILILVLLPLILIIFKPFGDDKTTIRYDNLLQFKELKFNMDSPIRTRILGYSESFDIIKHNIPFGTGFGGYKSQSKIADYINYPHNIFLETIIELGIPGIVLLLLLFLSITKSSIRISPILTAMLIYSCTLAFFSKDIPNQSFIFLIIAIIISRNKFNP